MDNPKDLSPLAKGEIEIGQALPFAIYDRQGVLLLAAGQAIATEKQLEELAAKGLYHNPRWAQQGFAVQNKATMGSVAPASAATMRLPTPRVPPDDPTETGGILKMNLPDQAESFSVRLVGSIGRAAFIISHPMKDERFVFIKEGQVWEFKSFYGLSVYRFTAQVDKVLLSPHPMVVLAWPLDTHVEKRKVRAARRALCELPATFRPQGSGHVVFNGIIHNISTGGVEFEFLADPGTLLVDGLQGTVACQPLLGERKFLIELPARVQNIQNSVPGQQLKVGMAFHALSDNDFLLVHAVVCDRLARRLQPPLYTDL